MTKAVLRSYPKVRADTYFQTLFFFCQIEGKENNVLL